MIQCKSEYFVFKGNLKNQAYNKEGEPIRILKKDKNKFKILFFRKK